MAIHQHNQPTTSRRSTNTPINSKQNLTSKTMRKQAGNLDYKTRNRHGHNNIAPNQQYCNKQNSTTKAKRKTSRDTAPTAVKPATTMAFSQSSKGNTTTNHH